MGFGKRGLRGSNLEELINFTNDIYRRDGLAVVQKIPTSITPVEFDDRTRQITLAYFEQKSTVDYMGAVQGIPICFDAKETSLTNLPLQNIHAHQVEFMEDFQNQKGLSFLLVSFSKYKEYYLLPIEVLRKFWTEAQKGGRKSIPYKAFDKELLIYSHARYEVHYLETIQILLNRYKENADRKES